MKQYKVVLFDLDHTLWDFDRNSFEALQELYQQHDLAKLNDLPFNRFHEAFQQVNTRLWDLYDRGLLDRNVIRYQRFNMILESLNITQNEIADRLSDDYLALSPTKSHLISGAREILDYLKGRYPLYLVTNGFTETQSIKAQSSRIDHYFDSIVTSELVGHKKPAKEIFEFTLNKSGFDADNAIMIGDNLLTDVAGASNARIDVVLFNPNHPNSPTQGGEVTEEFQSKITHTISNLLELKGIL